MAQLQTGGGKGNLATAAKRRDTNPAPPKKKNSSRFQIFLKELRDQTPYYPELGVASPDSGLLKGVGWTHQLRMDRRQMDGCLDKNISTLMLDLYLEFTLGSGLPLFL